MGKLLPLHQNGEVSGLTRSNLQHTEFTFVLVGMIALDWRSLGFLLLINQVINSTNHPSCIKSG